MKLTIDFETRSTVDLGKAGPWKYAQSVFTDVMCLAVKVDDEAPLLWIPDWVNKHAYGGQGSLASSEKFLTDSELTQLIVLADVIEAHNLEFERAIWRHIMHDRYGFKDLDLYKCDCTAARAAVMALPRKLEKACKVLKVSAEKDMEGHKLMMKMCKPRAPRKAEKKELFDSDPLVVEIDKKIFFHPESDSYVHFWHEKPEDFIRLFEYCKGDVEAEYGLARVVRPLSKTERNVWILDQQINERGITIDLGNVEAIIQTLKRHETTLLNKMKQLTNNAVGSPKQVAKLKDWLSENGVKAENLQKGTVEELMKGKLPPVVRKVLGIRQALAKASTAKFQAMINRASDDGRARSLFMYHGAGTGRWTAKAIQPQNMPRDCYKGKILEDVYEAFQDGDIEYIKLFFDDPFHAAGKCIRGALTAAPGHKLMAADYSSIEARGNAWQAGQESVLEAFRNGIDLYKVAAAGTFNIKYGEVGDDSHERLLGKVQILALGYQGGIGAFASMAVVYGIDLETLPAIVLPYATDEELKGPYGAIALSKAYLKKNPGSMSLRAAVACDVLKRKWRADNPSICNSWKKLEEAAFEAVTHPGRVFRFRRTSYRTWKDNNGNNYLICQLPSGRVLFYFDPQVRMVKMSWGENKNTVTCRTVDSTTKQWLRRPLYGGLLCENNVQAFCRDPMAEAQLRVESEGYPVVLHVHDEIVTEVREDFGNLKEFERIMSIVPQWAAGFPIKAKGWEGKRFRK